MTAKYYEAYDLRYKQIHQQHLQWAIDTPSPIVGEVFGRYPLPEGARILEIGCGTGIVTLPLASCVKEVTAIDASAQMLAAAWEKAETEERIKQFSPPDKSAKNKKRR